MTDTATFTTQAAALVAANDTARSPRQADVDGLRDLLDLLADFGDNDQRARYILTSNWFRDHAAQAAGWADVTGGPVPEQRRAAGRVR